MWLFRGAGYTPAQVHPPHPSSTLPPQGCPRLRPGLNHRIHCSTWGWKGQGQNGRNITHLLSHTLSHLSKGWYYFHNRKQKLRGGKEGVQTHKANVGGDGHLSRSCWSCTGYKWAEKLRHWGLSQRCPSFRGFRSNLWVRASPLTQERVLSVTVMPTSQHAAFLGSPF